MLGLSVTSSWGNGHATCYRALMAALGRRGHDVLFLERDQPWYASHRDLPAPPGGRTGIYASLDDLRDRFGREVALADLVVVGSYVPDGIAVGDWVLDRARGVVAFYDIDTPITLERLRRADCAYVAPAQIARYDLYLSFAGGPILRHLESEFGSPRAVELPCTAAIAPVPQRSDSPRYDLGYLGTYSFDRHQHFAQLLLEPAQAWPQGRFVVAGSMFPERVGWPENIAHVEHLSPEEHDAFYGSQRFTLNVTRAPMRQWGYSPSVRLFEAAARGVPVISDRWVGLDHYFEPGTEILVVDEAHDVLRILRETTPAQRDAIGAAAHARLARDHSPDRRAATLELELQRLRRAARRRASSPHAHGRALGAENDG